MSEFLTPQEVLALKQEIFSSLHCALPGTVEAFDAETQTATVRPALKRQGLAFPLIRDVSVLMPVPFDVFPGDRCLLIFADVDTDAWFAGGEAEEPLSNRYHSLSDAFALIGFGRRENA